MFGTLIFLLIGLPGKDAKSNLDLIRDGTKSKMRIMACLVLLFAITACDSASNKGGYPELEIINNEDLGYSILIPNGAKILQKSKFAHTYSYPLKGGLYEYNIHLTPWGANSLEDLVFTATLSGSKEILEKKEIGSSGYLVIRKRAGNTVEVWVNKRGATGAVNVKCWGPAKDRDYLLKIAESLKVQ